VVSKASRKSLFIASAGACISVVLVSWLLGGGTSQAFAVAPSGPTLPDDRAYEMVTPSDNQGADVYVPFEISEAYLASGIAGIHTQLPFQASLDGNAVAYVGDASLGGMGETGLGLGDEYLAQRSPQGGWKQTALQPPGLKSSYYQALSPNLTDGVLQSGSGYIGFEEPRISEVGSPGALTEVPQVPLGGYKFLYTHSGSGSEGIYSPLFDKNPPHRSVSEFGTANVPETDLAAGGVVTYAGASQTFSDLLFEANDTLAVGAVDGGAEANNLYMSIGGSPRLVNVLPSGESEANATFGAPAVREPRGNPPDFSHVLSSDGSRVFWTDLNNGALYMSEKIGSPDERTTELDASDGGQGTNGGGRFWTAAEDGSKVFFSDESKLTANSTAGPGAPDLYEYNFNSRENLRLTDLSVDPHAGEDADVQGVIGVSEEEPSVEEHRGEFVYFVAQGVLATNANGQGLVAESGQDNLYVLRQGSGMRFIAHLSEADGSAAMGRSLNRQGAGSEFGDWQPGLGHRTAEITPSGEALTFMSNNQAVGGYAPEVNGARLEEVYVYNYASNSLSCASCDPEQMPPPATVLSRHGIGGFLPPSWSNTFQSSWLSENGGRVVFDSTEPLVAGDVNGEPDVYEWERNGEGSCELAAGCVFLLSAGISESGSWLAAESASSDDVFIVTRSQLVPEDTNEVFSLFDARVAGTPAAITSVECMSVGCAQPPEQQPVFESPVGVSFEGVGNLPAPATVQSNPKPKKSVKKGPRAKKKKKRSRERVKNRSGSPRRGVRR
jgi:hypothetical protein